jgi:hypothetical protein
MALFKAYVADIMVHELDDQGMGDFVMFKDGYTIGIYETPQEAKRRICDFFDGVEFEGECAQASLIEDKDANPCENGAFIADYTIYVQRIENINLQDLP